MKHYATRSYRIEISSFEILSEGSLGHITEYDFVYIRKSEYRPIDRVAIRIFEGIILLKSAIIGSYGGSTGIHDRSVIVEEDRVLVCCSNTIFCLSIPDLTLLWRTQADEATCFGIYKHENSYFVHGEIEISRLDTDGRILWQRGGADIFTTLNGKDGFEIDDEHILVTDWEHRKYKFDLNGKSIS